jgi:hypothetical protein
MKQRHLLAGTSLLSILLLSFHFTQDALHARPGTYEAGAFNVVVVFMLAVVLSGTVLLAERRSGQLIMLIVALGAIAMPVLHFTVWGGGDMNRHPGAFFFVWCLIALGVNGVFSVLLLASEMPRVWRRPRRREDPEGERA